MLVRRRPRLAVAAAAIALLAAGCGDETETQTAGDVERFCELNRELDRAGDEAFKDIPENASEEDIRAAIKRLLDDNRDKIDEIEQVAPEEIRDDVRTFVDAQERAVEEGEAAFTDEVQQAEKELDEFEKRECGAQGGS